MRGLRLVVTTDDYAAALRFFRDGMGMVEQFRQEGPKNRVTILDAGLASLEIGDEGNAELVDRLEVGRRVAGRVRVALEVEDAAAATDTAVAHGARLVAPPVRTPWGSLNARLDAPGDVHLTLYSNDRASVASVPPGGVVELVEPAPEWATTGARLVREVAQTLGRVARAVHHAGSTAVPGLAAKPVIDLLLAVDDSTDEDSYVPALEGVGYVLHHREPEWHEHRLLKRTGPAVNLHVFALGSVEIDRMLDLREHLRADARDRWLYESTKRELATRTWRVVQDYADAKSAVVREILERAQGGGRTTRRVPPGTFVVVSGAPASGKSTLAAELADRLRLPLLAKDAVKDALVDELGAEDAEASRRLGRAAARAVVAAARGTTGAVLDGPWHHDRAAELAALPGRVVEVNVRADAETTLGRHAARPGTANPSALSRPAAEQRAPEVTDPVSGSRLEARWPVLTVDGTVPWAAPGLAMIARQVRQLSMSEA